MGHNIPATQDLISRTTGAEETAKVALDALAACLGEKAWAELEAMRAQLLDKFKNSGIAAEHEMHHAEIIRPTLEAINALFDGAVRRL